METWGKIAIVALFLFIAYSILTNAQYFKIPESLCKSNWVLGYSHLGNGSGGSDPDSGGLVFQKIECPLP